MDVIEYIKNEHVALLKQFGIDFELAKQEGSWQRLISYCEESIENNHHQKEEQYIFSAVQNNPKVRSGGPLCTYYFDSHLSSPNLRKAQSLVKKLTGNEYAERWSPQMLEIRHQNIPLTIPGEDHEAGRILLRGANDILKLEGPRMRTDLIEVFETYEEVQKVHFDREENCFLVMCKNLIPPAQWDQILIDIRANYPDI